MTDQCTEERATAKARQERCSELAFSYSLHIISLKTSPHTHTHPRPLIVTFEEGQLSAFSSTFLGRHERRDCAPFSLKETLYFLSVQRAEGSTTKTTTKSSRKASLVMERPARRNTNREIQKYVRRTSSNSPAPTTKAWLTGVLGWQGTVKAKVTSAHSFCIRPCLGWHIQRESNNREAIVSEMALSGDWQRDSLALWRRASLEMWLLDDTASYWGDGLLSEPKPHKGN